MRDVTITIAKSYLNITVDMNVSAECVKDRLLYS